MNQFFEDLIIYLILIALALSAVLFIQEIASAEDVMTQDGLVTEDSLWGKNGTYRRKNYDLKVTFEDVNNKKGDTNEQLSRINNDR